MHSILHIITNYKILGGGGEGGGEGGGGWEIICNDN